jgi:putative peptidoglycan lipid II flippase
MMEDILNTEGQYGWPAYAGLLVPLTTAILVLTIGRYYGVVVLCIGMLVGYCLQLCMVLVRARKAGLVYRFGIDLRNPAIRTILVVAWPVLIGALISQGSPLVDQIFASYLSPGSISALSYSLKLISVPVGVIFISVGRAALPYLSRQASINDMKAFKETLRLYLWAVGGATIVLTVLMFVFAHPIVQILFQRGAFTPYDTSHTASTIRGFVFGLVSMSLGFITLRSFSALGKTKVLLGVTAVQCDCQCHI